MTASRHLEPARAGRVPPRAEEQAGHDPAFHRGSAPVRPDRGPASTGVQSPGPLPTHDVEADPAPGVTEQGAT